MFLMNTFLLFSFLKWNSNLYMICTSRFTIILFSAARLLKAYLLWLLRVTTWVLHFFISWYLLITPDIRFGDPSGSNGLGDRLQDLHISHFSILLLVITALSCLTFRITIFPVKLGLLCTFTALLQVSEILANFYAP